MPAVSDPGALGELALFRGLTPAQLARLSELLRRRSFAPWATLLTPGQPGEPVYFILSGAAKVYLADADGAEVILAILTSGEVVGEMSLIDCASRCVSVVTSAETAVLWMGCDSFRECLRRMPVIEQNLTRLLCHRLRLANERIESLAVPEAEGRIARRSPAFAAGHGQATAEGEILNPFRLTQRDLAGLVGAARGRVSRVMSAYKQRHYLSVDCHHRIIVRNQEALRERARRAHRRLNVGGKGWGRPANQSGDSGLIPQGGRHHDVLQR